MYNMLLGNVQPLGQMEKRGTSGGECYGGYSSTTGTGSGPAYTNSCIHSGATEHSGGDTVWYNYVVASAGTITGTDNTVIATESICPKSWTLPSKTQIDNQRDITSFSPVLGGGYVNGTLVIESTNGYWWASTTYDGALRYLLGYGGTSLYTYSVGHRRSGLYIRCVSEEKDVSDLTYMQDMIRNLYLSAQSASHNQHILLTTYTLCAKISIGGNHLGSCLWFVVTAVLQEQQ